MLIALTALGCAALAAAVWQLHGKTGLRRLSDEARAELRDALRSKREVIHHYVHDAPWPYWWGYPYYGWWEERRTTVVYPTAAPAPRPQPAPSRQVVVGPQDLEVRTPQPRVSIQTRSLTPQAAEPPAAPEPVRRRLRRLL